MDRIGEFSKKTGASVKTLRYYDQIGLLKPSEIDVFTNYRYYGESELQNYKRIEYLKKLGFTLEEIKNNVDNMTLEFLDSKREELLIKMKFINDQIRELGLLRNNIEKNKVKSLKQ